MRFKTLLVAVAVAMVAPSALAIGNGSVVAEADARFDAVAAFGRTINLTGMNGAGNDHNSFCNGTLIAPDKMLMARHCVGDQFGPDNQPASGTFMFRFRRNPDGTIGTMADGWESFHQVEVTHFTFHRDGSLNDARNPDLLIAHLAEPVTHIAPIPLAPTGWLTAGKTVHFAGWGRDENGDVGVLKSASGQQEALSPGEPGGLTVCDNVKVINADGYTRQYDSGGGMFVFVRALPVPEGVGNGVVYGGGTVQPISGEFTPTPLYPMLVGVIAYTGNEGNQAFQHEYFEPCLYPLCAHRIPETEPCELPGDLNGDFVVDAMDRALAMGLLGPCPPAPNLCTLIDAPRSMLGGNGDGILEESEVNAAYDILEGAFCNCLEDLTGDGVVDIADLTILTDSMGPCDCEDPCPADLNGDRTVDFYDLSLMLAAMGPCDDRIVTGPLSGNP